MISSRWGALIGSALPASQVGPAGAAAGNLGRIKDLTTPHAWQVISPLARRLEGMSHQGVPITVEAFEAMPRRDREILVARAIEDETTAVRRRIAAVLRDYAAEITDRGRMGDSLREAERLLLYSQPFSADEIARERLANAYSYFSRRTMKAKEILSRALEMRKRLEDGLEGRGEGSAEGAVVSAGDGGRRAQRKSIREEAGLKPSRPGPIPESVRGDLTSDGLKRLRVLEQALQTGGIIEYPGPDGLPRRARVRGLSADKEGLIFVSLAGIDGTRRKETLTLAELGHFGSVDGIPPPALDLRRLSKRQRMAAPRSVLKGLASRWVESYEVFRKALEEDLPIEAEAREGTLFRAKVGLITTGPSRDWRIFVYLTDINGTRHAAAAPLLEGVRLLDRKASLSGPGRHERAPALPFDWRFRVSTLERSNLEPGMARKLSVLEQAMREGLTIAYRPGVESQEIRAKVEGIRTDYGQSVLNPGGGVNVLVSLIASDGTRRLSTLKALPEPRIASSKPEAPKAAGASVHAARVEVPASVREKLSRPFARLLDRFEKALREGILLTWMDHDNGRKTYGLVEQILADQSGEILVALKAQTNTTGPELFVGTLKGFLARDAYFDAVLRKETLSDWVPRPWIPDPGLVGGPGHADPRIRFPWTDLAREQDGMVETLRVLARALKEDLVIEYQNERTGGLVRARVEGIDGVLGYQPVVVLRELSAKGAISLAYAWSLKGLRVLTSSEKPGKQEEAAAGEGPEPF